jgi:hypothetical protein
VKIYCENCGSTQFLRHLRGCEAWKVAVEKPNPLHAVPKSSAMRTPRSGEAG